MPIFRLFHHSSSVPEEVCGATGRNKNCVIQILYTMINLLVYLRCCQKENSLFKFTFEHTYYFVKYVGIIIFIDTRKYGNYCQSQCQICFLQFSPLKQSDPWHLVLRIQQHELLWFAVTVTTSGMSRWFNITGVLNLRDCILTHVSVSNPSLRRFSSALYDFIVVCFIVYYSSKFSPSYRCSP